MAEMNRFSLYGDRQMAKGLTPEEVRAKLPKVGDRMKKIPTTLKNGIDKPPPMWGQVIYVNVLNFWYTVQFQEKGCRFRESYKVPETKEV